MADDRYTFEQARLRLEEIAAKVRGKDVSLEESLDLLEEGVRLANVCTELSDHTQWRTALDEAAEPAEGEDGAAFADTSADTQPVEGDVEPARQDAEVLDGTEWADGADEDGGDEERALG